MVKIFKYLQIEESAKRDFPSFSISFRDSGVNTTNFLKTSLNTIRKAKGEKLEHIIAFKINCRKSIGVEY